MGSSISGKTTLLIAKDPTENSSKLKKARDLGIQIMGYDEFAKQYGFNILIFSLVSFSNRYILYKKKLLKNY